MAKAPALRERETAPLATGLSLIEETNLMEAATLLRRGGVIGGIATEGTRRGSI